MRNLADVLRFENWSRARELQKAFSQRVAVQPFDGIPKFVAGVDVAFPEKGRLTRAAAVVLSYPALEIVDASCATLDTTVPYVPGFLSFREVPAIIEAFDRLHTSPDLVFCDGQGRAHPRRFGLACHLGLILDLPTLGVGKSRLVGRYDEPGPQRGDASDLMDGDEVIGRVVRTRERVKPVFLSVGHRFDLPSAHRWLMKCTTRYKLPEPIRQADRRAATGGRISP